MGDYNIFFVFPFERKTPQQCFGNFQKRKIIEIATAVRRDVNFTLSPKHPHSNVRLTSFL